MMMTKLHGQATAIASSDEGQRLQRQESMGGPGPIDNRTLMGEGTDLRDGMVRFDVFGVFYFMSCYDVK